MKLLSNKSVEKYFLTKKSEIKSESKVDLVLSPEFYWVRTFEIPVSTTKKALKLLHTLFEDILPNDKFDYYAIKLKENQFLCFAFNNDDILMDIKKSGLQLSQINSVYFAQTQMEDYSNFIIDDTAFIYDKDILMKIPLSLSTNAQNLNHNLDKIMLNNYKLNMKFYSNTINSKFIYTLVALFCCVTFINGIKYFTYSNEIKNLRSKIERIKKVNKMPRTNIQTNSILKNMQQRVSENVKFRDAFTYILGLKKIVPTGNIESIDFQNNRLQVIFSNINFNIIKNYIEKKYKIVNNNSSANLVKIEVQI